MALDLAIPFKNTFSSQLLLNRLGDFDKIWDKERSHCGDVHILRNYSSRIDSPLI
jgi:hypothetical protein